ncbi:MAG: hypothetical protein OEL83_11375 [Desulforhopalus sp.]|nr:hypothetical protein [Desulforhopalus sp.]
MKKSIFLFLILASTVPILSFGENPNFQKGQTTTPQMRQYFEGRKAEYNQYLADLAAYNQAIADQRAWDSQKNQEDQAQQQNQANQQAAINQKSQECSQSDPAEQQACQQAVTDMQNQMFGQAAEYAEYRQDRAGTRPVVGQQPTFHDNTAELAKAYIFAENQVLEEKVDIVGARNMKDEKGGVISNEEDVRAYYNRNYGAK